MGRCKELGEMVSVMEKEGETADGPRKRKIAFDESELSTSSVQLKTRRLDVLKPVILGNSACGCVNSNPVLVSCCSIEGSSELARGNSKSVDLEEEANELNVEFLATTAGDSVDFRDRRETTPSSEAQVQSGGLESTARPPRKLNSFRCSTTAKIPSEDELEEFFVAAERNLQKQFIDKYNYDIVKDEPLEGRYEWVQIQLKP